MTSDSLWHVTLTVAGDRVPADDVKAALERLSAERPFLMSGRYDETRAEMRYWEQARDCGDACAMALRLWGEHRTSAGLPPWRVVALEVVEQSERQEREADVLVPVGGWRPF